MNVHRISLLSLMHALLQYINTSIFGLEEN